MPDPSKQSGSSSPAKAEETKAASSKATTEHTTSGEAPLAGPTGATDTVPAAKGSLPDASKLAPAAESGDPDVHRLLAERQTAQTNLAAATPDDAAKARAETARRQIDAIDAQLADLGYTAR